MAIHEDTIRKAADMLREAAPAATIILFGSYANGRPGPDSDLDFLIIEPEVASPADEMVRLRRVLSPLRIPVDVLVTSQEHFRYWADTPGNVYHEAAANGRVLYEVA
ncbi:MAG: nucleotidyltransferase domain-containing protein [Phycisphaerae bacterium]